MYLGSDVFAISADGTGRSLLTEKRKFYRVQIALPTLSTRILPVSPGIKILVSYTIYFAGVCLCHSIDLAWTQITDASTSISMPSDTEGGPAVSLQLSVGSVQAGTTAIFVTKKQLFGKLTGTEHTKV